MRILELFAGIGGCAAAVGWRGEIVAAIDISRPALAVYRANFAHPTEVRTLEGLRGVDLRQRRADLWWMSPPCQPYTRRGRQRDLADPRARSLQLLTDAVGAVRPSFLVLENVPGFAGSAAHARLREALDGGGYAVEEQQHCPTELGIPNRRRRFFLVASRRGLLARRPLAMPRRRLAEYLDGASLDPELRLAPETAERYRGALDVVDAADPAAVAACFTAGYGRSIVRSGSYLKTADGLRRFSPAEILRLLAFPDSFRLPAGIGHRLGWRLVGNSLSVASARWILTAIPGMGGTTPEPPRLG